MSDQELTGARRAAAFLLSLDRAKAAEVLRHLRDDLVSDVAEAMTTLDEEVATNDRVLEIYQELVESVDGPPRVEPSDEATLSQLLSTSLGEEQGSRVLGEIQARKRAERPFAALEDYPPEALARVLASESPAVAAVVLAHVPPGTSAAVLQVLDEATALDVVRRMSNLTPPGSSTLCAIAADIEEQLEALGDVTTVDPARRLQSIAEMLAHGSEDLERSVLTGIGDEDADMAQEIRDFMFTWEDLSTVDKRAMQKILGSVNTKTLSIALKGCSAAVEDNILANLSSRVRDMVAEERDLAGAVPMTEVRASRDEIMQAVRGLMESGEFRPTRAGEDLVT